MGNIQQSQEWMNETRREVIREHETESAGSFIKMCLKIISIWGSLSQKPHYELVRIGALFRHFTCNS